MRLALNFEAPVIETVLEEALRAHLKQWGPIDLIRVPVQGALPDSVDAMLTPLTGSSLWRPFCQRHR